MKINKIVIYTDGASRGNPGRAGAGFVIYTESGEKLTEGYRYLGIKTNNQAEYEALIMALEKAEEMGADAVEIRSDSQLLVRQLNGEYRVKSKNIIPLFRRVKELLSIFGSVQFTHVPREQNREADALANRGVDEGLR